MHQQRGKKLDDLIKTIEELRQEKQTKELEAKDEGEAAKRINEHLSDFSDMIV